MDFLCVQFHSTIKHKNKIVIRKTYYSSALNNYSNKLVYTNTLKVKLPNINLDITYNLTYNSNKIIPCHYYV